MNFVEFVVHFYVDFISKNPLLENNQMQIWLFPFVIYLLNIFIACSTSQLFISITSQLSVIVFAIVFNCNSDNSLIFP